MLSILRIQSARGWDYAKELDLRSNVEKHAVGFTVAKTQALAIGLAERATGLERVLRTAGLEVVGWRGLDVCYNAAAWCACGRAVEMLAICSVRDCGL